MYKISLDHLCQQRQWAPPEYSSTKEDNPKFSATVTVNGVLYSSLNQRSTAKDAQTDAAQVALQQLAGVPVPSDVKPNPQGSGKEKMKTITSDQENLKKTVHISGMVSFFKNVGRVVDYKIMYDPFTGIKNGHSFILFDSEESVERALALDSEVLVERQVRIQRASVAFDSLRETNEVPPREICVAFIPIVERNNAAKDIRENLSIYGKIVGVKVEDVQNPNHVRAVVEFEDPASASRVHREQPLKIDGYIIHWM